MDLLTEQKINELEFDKKQAFPIIEELLWNTEPIVEVLDNCNEGEQEFIIAFLTQLALHRRIKVDAMVAILTKFGSAQDIADTIELLIDLGLATFNGISNDLIVVYSLNAEAQDIIAHHRTLIPMIVVPKPATFSNCGMYAVHKHCVTRRIDNWVGDICLESIDRKNEVALTINTDVATAIVNKSKSGIKRKADEEWDEYQKRIDSWDNFCKLGIKDINRIVNYGNKFWLPHVDDKRGRMYDSGYSIKYQGNCYQKGCVEFYEKEVLPNEQFN